MVDLCGRPHVTVHSRPLHTVSSRRLGEKVAPMTSQDKLKDVDVVTRTKTTTKRTIDTSHPETPPREVVTEMTAEYKTVSRDEPYEIPVEHDGDATREKCEQKEQRLRYGGLHRYASLHKPSDGENDTGGTRS